MTSSRIDLYWLPLGAGGWFVRFNGRVYESISRPRRILAQASRSRGHGQTSGTSEGTPASTDLISLPATHLLSTRNTVGIRQMSGGPP
jgi:hypothetical protein